MSECCTAAVEAVQIIRWEAARSHRPDLTFEAYASEAETEAGEKQQETTPITVESGNKAVSESVKRPVEKRTGGCVIDLHIHSFPASPCSSVNVDDLIQEAKRIQLDAVCLTDHNYVWDAGATKNLSQKHGLLVLRGNEITTDQGDMLVFGMHRDVTGIISLTDLREMVDDDGGFMIVAHPFRGFLVFNTSQIGLTAEKAMQRSTFRHVHAIEILNGKVTEKENLFAKEVATGLGLPMTGGSDAHEVSEVGKYATRFAYPIGSEKELVEALKSGAYEPCAFRREADLK